MGVDPSWVFKRMRHQLILVLVFFAGARPASAGLIQRDATIAIGGSQISRLQDGGQRWEIGNDLHCVSTAGCSSSINDPSSFDLEVGDTFRLTTRLNRSLHIVDSSGYSELFRAFMLRGPFGTLDVSSIGFTSTVELFDGPLSSLPLNSTSAAPSEAYGTHGGVGGVLSVYGLETIFGGDFLSTGSALEIWGWKYEMTILSDPNGLLRGSYWPWHSFAIDAESITVGDAPPVSVPEPGTLALFSGVLGLIAIRQRRQKTGGDRIHFANGE